MILTCPSCRSRYFADPSAIGPHGRTVRCNACSHSWFVEGQLDLREPVGDGASAARTRDQIEQMRRAAQTGAGLGGMSAAARLRAQQAERERRERAGAAMMAWGVTGAAVVGMGAGAVGMREHVASIWPQTAGVYAALGMGVNLYGLEIDDLTVAQDFDGGEPVYVVRGAVRNIGREDKAAPLLRFGLRDDASAEIHAQLADLEGRTIPAGGRLAFEFRLDGPVERAADLEASFESRTAASPASAQSETEGVLTLGAADAYFGAPVDIDGAPVIDGLAGRMDATVLEAPVFGDADRQG